jgi:hypothetical protein
MSKNVNTAAEPILIVARAKARYCLVTPFSLREEAT